MNYKNYLIFFILCTPFYLKSYLTVSQYKPESFIQKSNFEQDYFLKFSTISSGGFAHQAYNSNKQKVSFLEQYGQENLLKQFTDQSLPQNNIESMGYGQLQGQLKVRELILNLYKNMHYGFFLEGSSVIQDLMINDIAIDFIPMPTNVTNEQLNYLALLQQKIPKSLNRSGMFCTALYTGWNKTFTHLTHLDFVDLSIKAGIMSPQKMKESNSTLLQFPALGNLNFGYPITITTAVGLLDWMTLGYSGSVTPWQKNTCQIAMNNNLSGNILLLSSIDQANIQRGPLFNTTLYFEADHVYQGFSGTFAYNYTYSYAYEISPINEQRFQKALINQSPRLQNWSLGSIYLEMNIDLACEAEPNAPSIIMFCNIPIKRASHLSAATNIFGASCSLQMSYAF